MVSREGIPLRPRWLIPVCPVSMLLSDAGAIYSCSAEQQRDSARRIMDNYSAPNRESVLRRAATSRRWNSFSFCKTGTAPSRATLHLSLPGHRGILPGYNFPGCRCGRLFRRQMMDEAKQVYLQRPRFLALSEFGPRSLVYHEGRAYRVVRAMVTVGRDATLTDRRLSTQTVRICSVCGAGHFQDQTRCATPGVS